MNPFKADLELKKKLQQLNKVSRDTKAKQMTWSKIERKTVRMNWWDKMRRRLLHPIVIGPAVAFLLLLIIPNSFFNENSPSPHSSDQEIESDGMVMMDQGPLTNDEDDSPVESMKGSEEIDDKDYLDVLAYDVQTESDFENFYQFIQTETVADVGDEYKNTILNLLEDLDQLIKLKYMEEIIDLAQYLDPAFYENYPALLYNLFETDPMEFLNGLTEIDMGSEEVIVSSLTQYGKEKNKLSDMLSKIKHHIGDKSLLNNVERRRWNDLVAALGYEKYAGTDVEGEVLQKSEEVISFLMDDFSGLASFIHQEQGIQILNNPDKKSGLLFSRAEINSMEEVSIVSPLGKQLDMKKDEENLTSNELADETSQHLLDVVSLKYYQDIPNHPDELSTIHQEYPAGLYAEFQPKDMQNDHNEGNAFQLIFEDQEGTWYLVGIIMEGLLDSILESS
ncbi:MULTISPECIES: hypothetical protein [Bacillaceae]|uniref:Uncharacterized protein n=1 Tax=Evansella alkalicola TaxID=745819 RepID=A0ABS6JWZ0_9BACI|nr:MULTISPECIES: hypothetical protein [Bacillaceae]MBU9722189.1 hypothetical protein [Bacillus alkalicola]